MFLQWHRSLCVSYKSVYTIDYVRMKHFPTLFYIYLASVNSWTEDTCAARPLAYVNKAASPGVTIVLAKSETRLTSAGACICLSIMMCAQLYANDWTIIMLFLLFAGKSIFVSVVFFLFFLQNYFDSRLFVNILWQNCGNFLVWGPLQFQAPEVQVV